MLFPLKKTYFVVFGQVVFMCSTGILYVEKIVLKRFFTYTGRFIWILRKNSIENLLSTFQH